MRTIGNILWAILFGWWNAIGYIVLGGVFCITIVGIPIGKALFEYAKLMFMPFGKQIVKETDLKGKENVALIRRIGGTIVNILWLPVGIILFLGTLFEAVICFISIIGIPIGFVLIKSAVFIVWPIGAKVVAA